MRQITKRKVQGQSFLLSLTVLLLIPGMCACLENPIPPTIEGLNRESKVIAFVQVSSTEAIKGWDRFNPIVEVSVKDVIGMASKPKSITLKWGLDPSGFKLNEGVTPPVVGSTWVIYFSDETHALSGIGFSARYGQGIHAASPEIWAWMKKIIIAKDAKVDEQEHKVPKPP